MVRLGFLGSAPGKNHGNVGAQPVGLSKSFAVCWIDLTNAGAENLPDYRHAHALRHALRAVVGERVSYLMPHHDGDAVVVLSNRHDAFPKCNLAAGKAEGVDFVALQDIELPLIVEFRCGGGNPLTDLL